MSSTDPIINELIRKDLPLFRAFYKLGSNSSSVLTQDEHNSLVNFVKNPTDVTVALARKAGKDWVVNTPHIFTQTITAEGGLNVEMSQVPSDNSVISKQYADSTYRPYNDIALHANNGSALDLVGTSFDIDLSSGNTYFYLGQAGAAFQLSITSPLLDSRTYEFTIVFNNDMDNVNAHQVVIDNNTIDILDNTTTNPNPSANGYTVLQKITINVDNTGAITATSVTSRYAPA